MGRNARLGAIALVAVLAGCGGRPAVAPTTAPVPTAATTSAPAPTTAAAAPTPAGTGATAAPAWLGTRVLPAGPAGYPLPVATPPELTTRRIVTVEELPPPADGAFHSTVTPVPAAVQARSTWSARCPVTLAELRHVTVGFRGFDGRPHTGELLVHRDVADAVVTVFRRLFALGFPIERMRVTSAAELAAPPTGDGNTTAGFACRPTRGATTWSAHAYGKAIDVDPFQNPYRGGDRVLPELATTYLDRDRQRPGMITPAVVAAFRAAGWTWGGGWTSPVDLMHFTATGH